MAKLNTVSLLYKKIKFSADVTSLLFAFVDVLLVIYLPRVTLRERKTEWPHFRLPQKNHLLLIISHIITRYNSKKKKKNKIRVTRERAKAGPPSLTNPKMFPHSSSNLFKIITNCEKKFHRLLLFLSQGPVLIAPPLNESPHQHLLQSIATEHATEFLRFSLSWRSTSPVQSPIFHIFDHPICRQTDIFKNLFFTAHSISAAVFVHRP